MPRPSVLIVEPDSVVRDALSRGLTEAGYETVPTGDPAEGERFADGLGPAVIVAPAGVGRFGDGTILEQLPENTTLVLIGNVDEGGDELSGKIFALNRGELSEQDLLARLRLLLIGHEIGVDADVRLESLVGDLALKPLLELVRALHRRKFSGRVSLARGGLGFRDGEVVSAQAGNARGPKAFCRLSRSSEDPFHVYLDEAVGGGAAEDRGGAAEDRGDGDAGLKTLGFDELVHTAVKDSLGKFPDPRCRLSVKVGEDLFRTPFSEIQQEILVQAHREVTIQELLDALAEPDGTIVRELMQLEELGLVACREPEPAVRIVTDSTADLPPVIAEQHGITVVPLTVRFGEEVFQDRVDLQPGEFYRKLATTPSHPVSNPPSPESFGTVYRQHLAHGDVVSVHISRKLSLTVERARQAAAVELRLAGDERSAYRPQDRPPVLEVVDSRQLGMGTGLLTIFAARLAARGEVAEVIAERLKDMRRRILLMFAVDTLEYLARGGRIGKASALVGGLLRIKPILTLKGGEIEPVDRVMGRRALLPRLVKLVRERLDPERPTVVAIAHGAAPVLADQLQQMVETELRVAELFLGETGPVIGTHGGPGGVGIIAFQPKPDEEALIAPLDEETADPAIG